MFHSDSTDTSAAKMEEICAALIDFKGCSISSK
jgi:hypothetical protein